MQHYHYTILLFFTLPLNGLTVSTLFGLLAIEEPVLIELIESQAFKRLFHIKQYGITQLVYKQYSYNRGIHSLGVLHLLRMAHCSINEQIAGLLHDVSHTVFSHVGDVFFDVYNKEDSYQDTIHAWFIKQTDIPAILARYNIALEDILHKEHDFPCLEQSLPNLCADRLEYILHGSYEEGLLSSVDIAHIIANLSYNEQEQCWQFASPGAALMVGTSSLYLNEYIFAAPYDALLYRWMTEALKRAISINELTLHDIHWGIDQEIWQRLQQSNDPLIHDLVNKMRHHFNAYTLTTREDCSYFVQPKFRGVDPIIKTAYATQRLTELLPTYKSAFETTRNRLAQGWAIAY